MSPCTHHSFISYVPLSHPNNHIATPSDAGISFRIEEYVDMFACRHAYQPDRLSTVHFPDSDSVRRSREGRGDVYD